MVTGLRYTTTFDVDEAMVKVNKKADGQYEAVLTAMRKPWRGRGKSVVLAIEAALQSVKDEKKSSEKGRASNRFKIARSLL
jgi:hypothetical protein